MPGPAVRERARGRRASIAYLDGRRLSRGLDAGIRRLVADQDRLNRINVFPVPDGDTGTNLALTMAAVRQALDGTSDRRAGPTLERVADAALDGARGNSGAILAQFFLGLGDACADLDSLDVGAFAGGVRAGADYAREALSIPREGTILTVLSEFADELGREAARTVDFTDLLVAGLRRSQQALAATRDQLEELRRADVVDAGAQGFVDLLEGVVTYIREGSAAAPGAGDAPAAEDAFPELGDHQDLEHRYCTECMITGDGIDRRALREALTPLGGSLVVAGTHRKVRVHVHVDDPDRVFALAAEYGRVSSHKADDMRQQQGAARAAAGRIAIVVDSAGDVPEA